MKCFWQPGYLLIFLICSHCIIISVARSQTVATGGILNNYELLSTIGDDLVEKVVKKSGVFSESQSVVLLASSTDSVNWFLEKRLSNYLIDSEHEVYTAVIDSVGCKKYLIQYQTIEIGIRYKAEPQNGLKLERKGFINAAFKVTDCRTNKILLNDIFFESKTDWINDSDKENIENSNIDITVGKLAEDLPTIRFKPVIISAITGTIVYLFYALRSR